MHLCKGFDEDQELCCSSGAYSSVELAVEKLIKEDPTSSFGPDTSDTLFQWNSRVIHHVVNVVIMLLLVMVNKDFAFTRIMVDTIRLRTSRKSEDKIRALVSKESRQLVNEIEFWLRIAAVPATRGHPSFPRVYVYLILHPVS